MKNLVIIFSLLFILGDTVLFDFNKDSDLSSWYIVDDVVMGGRSSGDFKINLEGHAVFFGQVSLENNGGFSSVRCRIEKKSVKNYSKIKIRLKGDGKRYQFRVKSQKVDNHSYVTHFQTDGEWQSIEIPLKDLYPSWRGMKLDMPNYPAEELSEMSFLIANYRAENFILEIDSIVLL